MVSKDRVAEKQEELHSQFVTHLVDNLTPEVARELLKNDLKSASDPR